MRPVVHTFVQRAQHIQLEHILCRRRAPHLSYEVNNLKCRHEKSTVQELHAIIFFFDLVRAKVCACDSIYLFIYANCANLHVKDYARKKRRFFTPQITLNQFKL